MASVQTDIPCIITGSHEAEVVCDVDRHGDPLRTVISKASGLVFTDPRPSHDEVKEFYTDLYRQEYKGTVAPKKKHVYRAGRVALDRWENISPYISTGDKVLDAGAGGGELVYLLGKKGCKVSGIEPNRGYANHAIEQYDVDIQVGFFEDANFDAGAFDAVLLFHVLEHLENPVEEIKRLKKFLKPGGTFVIEVPNVTYTQGYPTAKWHIGHLYNFNQKTLGATALKAGMDVVELRELGDGGNLFGVFSNIEPTEAMSLNGNFEQVSEKLAAHTVVSHLFSLNPYVRPVKKLCRSIMEKLAIMGPQNSRELLDKLYNAIH